METEEESEDSLDGGDGLEDSGIPQRLSGPALSGAPGGRVSWKPMALSYEGGRT